MKTIMTLTDFSVVAKNAAIYACELASLIEGEVMLVHAFPFPLPVPVKPITEKQLEESRKDRAEELRSLTHELHESYPVLMQHQMIEGFLLEELNKLITHDEVDLVMMGLRREDKLTRGLFGSVAAYVIEKAAFPVLVIPEGSRFKKIKKIVFATDFINLEDPLHLKPIRELAEIFNAEIQILHVFRKSHSIDPHFAIARLQMDRYFYPSHCSYHLEEEENILERIEEFVEKEDAGIVAIISHRYTFWEKLVKSTHTRKILFETSVPLLVIPDLK
ncbi:universal stress protein [Catalinimonas niigatensis]|uniref:universal stress protein n=1 Tax=Catalinimonas niigatensis TaxID=1397264 RepID=UPI002665E167|nr:universal stress protein [Catalinimonas niigatensis]WPP49815.1 universal stress protein [Catalinimonas niigatensis]